MMSTKAIPATIAALIVVGVMAREMAPRLHTETQFKPNDYRAAKESIAFSLFGQLRMSVCDLMWLKTLEYLHNGVIYRMPSERERTQGVRAHDFAEMGAGVAHQDGPSLIPEKERDWRGLLGEFNRQIEPWRPGHPQHSDPQELIPWYRLLVRFNPHFIHAYTNGAFFMSDFAQQPEMARQFLSLGAEKNPWSFEIMATLGRICFDHFKDYQAAVAALESALELAREEKRALTDRDDTFDRVQKQLLGESHLFLARAHTELGEFGKAIEVCDAGLEEDPTYNLLRVQKRIAGRKTHGTGEK
jgi:hypothetical protein